VIYFLLFVGGGIGTMLRHAVNVLSVRWFGAGFPFHTFFENVSGSLVMGLFAGYFAFRSELPQDLRLFLMTGIVGATRPSRHSRSMLCCCRSAGSGHCPRSMSRGRYCFRSAAWLLACTCGNLHERGEEIL